MAHYKRKRSRTQSSGHYSSNGLSKRLDAAGIPEGSRRRWTKGYPRYWDKINHTSPTRAEVHLLTRQVLIGTRDADDTVWPDGRKPHIYYW